MATAPKYDLAKALGHDNGTEPVQWNRRDLILYALSIGAHKDQFNLIFEDDPNFQAFPLFGATLSFKGPETDTVNFAKKFGSAKPIDGMPPVVPQNITQAMQYVEVIKPLPTTAKVEDGFTVKSTVVGIHENSIGVDVDNELIIAGPDGTEYTRLMSRVRHQKMVANGTPFDKVTSEPTSLPKPIASLGRPTWIATAPTWPEQSVVYRLNGDYNYLHIKPEIGIKLGFGGLICHGLGMLGLTTRAMLEKIADNDPKALGSICAQFVNPLTPGDPLLIRMWDLGPGVPGKGIPAGSTAIAFQAYNPKGQVSLGDGIAYITKTTKKIIETDPRATAFESPVDPTKPVPTVTPAGVVKQKEPVPFVIQLAKLALFGPADLAAKVLSTLVHVALNSWSIAEVLIGLWFAPLFWIWGLVAYQARIST